MAQTPDFVCSNPQCRSYGVSHKNCKCIGPGERNPSDHYSSYASGGAIHYCATGMRHQSDCEHFANGGEVSDNQEFLSNPDLAIDHAVLNKGLLHTLSKTGKTKSEDPNRPHSEFLDHARKGKKSLSSLSSSILDSKRPKMEPDMERAKSLETHLKTLQANPENALDIGGNLGDTLPFHHAALAAKAATAMGYLAGIKPRPTPAGPLDEPIPISKVDERAYARQLHLTENPSHFYEHVKNGAVHPQDIQTLQAVYPKLRAAMQNAAFDAVTKAKTEGKDLSHAQKRRFAALLGETTQFEQSPAAAMAIMKANAPAQMPPPPAKKPKKASGVELAQINKVNELSETPLQKLQTARNS